MTAPRCATPGCERFGTVPMGRSRALCAFCARSYAAMGGDVKVEPRPIAAFRRPTFGGAA